MVSAHCLILGTQRIVSGDMDQALPLPIARHFYKEYSLINSNLTYIELPRTGHTPTSRRFSLRNSYQY